MPRTIRFDLDENVGPAIAARLRRHGIDVTTTAEAGLQHAPDEHHIAYGIAHSRVIFTQDKHFLRFHALGTPHAGISYYHQQTRRGDEMGTQPGDETGTQLVLTGLGN